MKVYNKIVRDKYPEIIVESGDTPQFKILSGEAYANAMKLKLVEEAQEFLAAETREQQIEELADIYEVIDTLRDIFDLNFTDICKTQIDKNNKKGKFRKGYFLQKVFER